MKKILLFMLVFLLVLSCTFAIVLSTEWGKEFFYRYRAEIFSATGSFILFVLGLDFKLMGSKENKHLDENLMATRGPLVDAMNGMIDGYNAMKAGYDERALIDEGRDRAMAIVMAQNTFLMEMLQTVYANSKNLPQGVKNIINIKYAKCLKAIGDEETLKRLADLFKKEISKVGAESGEKVEPPKGG